MQRAQMKWDIAAKMYTDAAPCQAVKLKVYTLSCYSATYMSQTRDQQRFTISEVAADWHEPVVPQRIYVANWTHGAANRHTIATISHTRPSPGPVAVATNYFPFRWG